MSRSTALVLARQIASAVARDVDVDDSPAVRRLVKKGQSTEVARGAILTRTARNALTLARGDDKVAQYALVIVNARGNRLPQAINLLKRHNAELVAAAYRLHDELQFSTCSIAHMCRIIEALGYVPEEDDNELAEVLDEITTACVSQAQGFYWMKRIPELIKEHGPFLEAILDYVIGDIKHSPNHFGLLTIEDEDEFWESQASREEAR